MVNISPINLPGFHPSHFFRKLGLEERGATYCTSGQWIIIAWNPKKTFVIKQKKDIVDIRTFLQLRRRSVQTAIPFVGGVIGSVSYDFSCELLAVDLPSFKPSVFPKGIFHVFESAVLWNGKTVTVVGDASFRADVERIHRRVMPVDVLPSMNWKSEITRTEYGRIFRRIKRDIQNGEYYQLNAAYHFTSSVSCDPRLLFLTLLRRNPASCASYLEHGFHAIVSLSPERFVTIDSGRIVTSPIKGTRPRGRTVAEDNSFQRALMQSDKEKAELNMITDLLRNDIGKVSVTGSVRVRAHRLLQKNPSVWHTYSLIEGRLRPDVSPFDAYLSMMPGGSVTGCPKVAAIQAIDDLERRKRGAYCGSMFMASDHGFFDSSILIRTIVAARGTVSLGVGGGIVADSIVSEEWDETLRKAQPFLALAEDERRYSVNGATVTDGMHLPFLDPTNAKSIGVFETMRVEGRRVLHLAEHLRRLEQSALRVGMQLPASRTMLKRWIKNILPVSHFLHSVFRLKIVCTTEDTFMEVCPLVVDPAIFFGVSVTILSLERRLPEAKALPYHREWHAYRMAVRHGHYEALLEDSEGCIREGSQSNLFWVKAGVLHTAGTGVLPGITRAHVLRAARAKRLTVCITKVSRQSLLDADEVFLTKSTVGVVPVTMISGKRVGRGTVGAITRQMMLLLSQKTVPNT